MTRAASLRAVVVVVVARISRRYMSSFAGVARIIQLVFSLVCAAAACQTFSDDCAVSSGLFVFVAALPEFLSWGAQQLHCWYF